MALTQAQISDARSDKALFELLTTELGRLVPAGLHDDLDAFVATISRLSPGLRAMAATHQLDVSMALDDLAWHFANWHHRGYCQETSLGLRELEIDEAADIFDAAYALTLPHWDTIGEMLREDFDRFGQWYEDSELEKALRPLNSRMWDLCAKSPDYALMSYWLIYARTYPDRVVG